MKIATWNVNSIRARLPVVLDWLDEARPDVALLQETKVVDGQFPAEPLEERGYNLAVVGEGGRNGVAILAKRPIEDVRRALPGDPDDLEARYLEAVVGDVRVASVYVPNGTALSSPRFPFKLAFLERLRGNGTRRERGRDLARRNPANRVADMVEDVVAWLHRLIHHVEADLPPHAPEVNRGEVAVDLDDSSGDPEAHG